MPVSEHIPVLVDECVHHLDIQQEDVIVDATFGQGGHAHALYDKMKSGKLIAMDLDPGQMSQHRRFEDGPAKIFHFVHSNFKHIERQLKYLKIDRVSCVLCDLGLSNFQLKASGRGFSYQKDEPLDMRFNGSSAGWNAQHVVNTFNPSKLAEIFRDYGELKNARKLGWTIHERRKSEPIVTSFQLRDIALEVSREKNRNRYLSKVFQALRIHVNDELNALKEFLENATRVLKTGGRLVVISYHSLEDRLVKRYMAHGNFTGTPEKDFYGNPIRPMKPLVKKPVTPGEEEVSSNPASRSAKLRVAQKL